MGRATIPYDDLTAKVRQMFPAPGFKNVRIRKPDRYNDLKAPTTIYDRSGGNYARIGYKVSIRYDVFLFISEDLQAIYETRRSTVLVEL